MTCSRPRPFLERVELRKGIAAFLKFGVLFSVAGSIASAPFAGAQVAEPYDQAVIYTLVSVNGHELPTTVAHGKAKISVRSGTFTIKADGTCTSMVEFEMPSNAVVTRDIRAKYVREGSKLQMQWEGAGKTVGIISGENFTMDNEGMQFAYKSQSAKTKQQALDRFIGKWRSLTPQRGPAEMTSEVQFTYRVSSAATN